MKTMMKLPAILLGLVLLLTGTTQVAMAQNDDVSLQSFYDELSPYGQWIQDPQYGYVWRPDVDQEEFRPYYSNGRWAMTEYGNTWVSNYDWGWAPFHYGRWVYNQYNSWVWIPDTVWGPAWVSWRSGGGYYGWAPLGPSISIGINIGRGGYRIPDMCWNFIPYNNIYYSSYPRYYGSRNRIYIQNTVIINNTYVRNNRTYYTGPRADEIRRSTNQNVTVYNVNRSSRPGASRIDNNTINIYNPRPVRGSVNANAAPRNVVQGSINRGVVGRDNAVTASRGDRGNTNQGGDRSANMNTRPTRDGNEVNSVQPNRGTENRGRDANVGSQPQRAERGSQSQPQQRVERSQQAQPQQRVERPQPQERAEKVERPQPQQRAERPQPQERVEKVERVERVERPQPQQQAPQRVERVERQQPQQQRVERSSPPPQRSSGGGESRSSRGNGNGGGRVRGGE